MIWRVRYDFKGLLRKPPVDKKLESRAEKRYAPAREGGAEGKELSSAPHDYITPPKCSWPMRRIMAPESEKTYAMLDPMTQKLAVLGLLAGSALSVFVLLAIFMPLAAMPLLANAQSGGIGFGPAAFIFLAAAIILSTGIAEAYITIKNMLITYRFSLQNEYIFMRTGTINPAYHMIPYENIQDAQVSQDILLKMFNLASVTVSTPASTLVVSPLPLGVANRFRQDVLTQVRLHKGMAE